jgi:hypothetical protein
MVNGRRVRVNKSYMKTMLIAPCGMNCAICSGFLRDKNKCPGCTSLDNEVEYSKRCIIRNCEFFKESKIRFCYACDKYPCKRLKALDKRYRTRYEMSMIKNLEYIKVNGVRKFTQKEKKRWQRGDKILCVHNKKLY